MAIRTETDNPHALPPHIEEALMQQLAASRERLHPLQVEGKIFPDMPVHINHLPAEDFDMSASGTQIHLYK